MDSILGVNVTPTTVSIALLKNNQILEAIIHKFNKGESPKGESLALPRREARSVRRQIKRRKWRRKHLLSTFNEPQQIVESFRANLSPWQLRVDALSRKLNGTELLIALYHIIKRRGFKSSRKNSTDEKEKDEKKKMLTGISELTEAFKASKYSTIGEYLFYQPKRKNTDGCYTRTVTRDLIIDEVNTIFKKQKEFGNIKLTDEFITDFFNVLNWQTPIKSYVGLIGNCTLDPSEKRASKFAYSAECFKMLSKLMNLKFIDNKHNEQEITLEDKLYIFKLAHTQKKITYSTIRRKLKVTTDYRFNLINYRLSDRLKKSVNEKFKEGTRSSEKITWDEIVKDCEDHEDFKDISLPGYHELKSTISAVDKQEWVKISQNISLMDQIASTIALFPDEIELTAELSKLDLPPKIVDSLLPLSFKGTINLSLKTVNRLLPHLKKGLTYPEAVKEEKFSVASTVNKVSLIPAFEKTNNPVVDRALSRTRKVVNAVLRKHGMPTNIHIELSTELSKSKKERNEISKHQNNNKQHNKDTYEEICNLLNRKPTSIEIEKYKLWLEQDKLSFYSGKPILERHLADPTATEIDYILPFARSFDNSQQNKVLCFTDENRDKSKKTAFEMFGKGIYWQGIQERAKKLSRGKSERILIEYFDERIERVWQERYLNDTRYIARKLKEHLLSLDITGKVHIRKSAAISYLRNIWGLDRVVKDDRMYVIDAACIAACTDDMMIQISNYNKYKDYLERAKGIKEPPKPNMPWISFANDVKAKLEGIFDIRTPIGKYKGTAHAEKILSVKKIDGKIVTVMKRISLQELTIKNIEDIINKDTSNKHIYEALHKQLILFPKKVDEKKKKKKEEPEFDGKKAFAQGFTHNGMVIRKIKIYVDRMRGVEVRGGLAHNKDNIRRVDIFKYQGKLYSRIIYTYNVAKKEIPAYCEGLDIPINSEFKFICSIQKNEFIECIPKEGNIVAGYFKSIQPVTGSIHIDPLNDQDPKDVKGKSIGLGTLDTIKKYDIDFFGNKNLVRV